MVSIMAWHGYSLMLLERTIVCSCKGITIDIVGAGVFPES